MMSRTRQPLRRALLIALLALVAMLPIVTLSAGSTIGAAQDAPFMEGQLIVGFKASAGEQHQDQVVARHSDQTIRAFSGIRARLVKLSGGRSVAQAIQDYQGETAVAYAEPNYIVHATTIPNDPQFSQLWGLRNTGQSVLGIAGTPGADIKAEPAWTVTTGSSTVVVGVVDTGVDYTHPDLAANIWNNPGGIGGCPVGTHGYNAIIRTCDPLDDNNHGTHVSGTIGAVGNNGIGVVGVNWTVSIMGLKFLSATGSGTIAGAIIAIDFAVQAKIAGINVRALNNSWGGGGFSQALLDEINKAGANDILFVVAAGNSSVNVDTHAFFPCSYTTASNLICVAATDQVDGLAWFSNFGAGTVHLGAPGTSILSTVIGGLYDYFNGTSMATPHVTGAAALILSKQALTVAQLKGAILNNVDPLPSLAGITVTGGRLNVCKAIPGCGTTPTTPGFSLSVTPTSQTVVQGGFTTYTVTRTGSFVGTVTLSVTGLPSGASGVFNPNGTTGTSSTLTVTTSTTTPTGSFQFTITGNSAGPTPPPQSTSATLVVNSVAPPPPPPPPPPCDDECPPKEVD